MSEEDKDLALLAALELYDRQLVREALVQHRYKVWDDMRASMGADKPFSDRHFDVKVGLDRIDRITELLEALA